VILDVNSLPAIFDRSNAKHSEFKPVYDSIMTGLGIVVFGGATYLTELKAMPRYLVLLAQLEKKRKVLKVNDAAVDVEEKRVAALCTDVDFDDPHLVAIVIVGRCRLVCTCDRRAVPYLKMAAFYPLPRDRPKVYSGARNAGLLNDRRLVQKCLAELQQNDSRY
jgi:hypothetical protein